MAEVWADTSTRPRWETWTLEKVQVNVASSAVGVYVPKSVCSQSYWGA